MQTNENTSQEQDTIIDAGSNPAVEAAVTVVKEVDHALVVTNPAQYAKDLFEPFFAELTSARRKASAAKYDVTTPAGMEAAKMHAQTFTKIRTRADKLKTERKKPIDQAGKVILAEYERLATAAKAEQDKHDKAVSDEKLRLEQIEEEKRAKERARIEAIELRLSFIRAMPNQLAKADAATLQARIEELLAKQLEPALYDEFLEQAAEAMIETTEALRELHTEAVEKEKAAAELVRLRAEEEERKATAAATAKAQADAAAALAKQQAAMTDIMLMQGLPFDIIEKNQASDRAIVEAALAKARAFDPASFGSMAPMATLARDTALPQLEAMLASLPEAAPVAEEPAPAPMAKYMSYGGGMRTVVDRADPVDVVTESAPCADVAKAIPAPIRPSDMAILEAMAVYFDVPAADALGWLATFDAHAVHILLTEG